MNRWLDEPFNAANLLERIGELKNQLPKKQCLLCNYILTHCDDLSIVTVAELAERAGVGTTTVLRLIKALGYDGFPQFKRDLSSVAMMHNESSYRNIKQVLQGHGDALYADRLTQWSRETIGAIQNFLTPKNSEQYDRALDLLAEAHTIYIYGLRSSRAAAMYMGYAISPVLPNIHQLSQEPDFVFDRILGMEDGDVMVIFSNWPCTQGMVDVARTCHQRGVPIFLITNSIVNPVAKYCDVVIDTNAAGSPSMMTPTVAIIEGLVADISRRNAETSSQRVEKLESMLREHQILEWS